MIQKWAMMSCPWQTTYRPSAPTSRSSKKGMLHFLFHLTCLECICMCNQILHLYMLHLIWSGPVWVAVYKCLIIITSKIKLQIVGNSASDNSFVQCCTSSYELLSANDSCRGLQTYLFSHGDNYCQCFLGMCHVDLATLIANTYCHIVLSKLQNQLIILHFVTLLLCQFVWSIWMGRGWSPQTAAYVVNAW